MKVKFKYDLEDIHICKIKEMQSNVSEEDIKSMYLRTMGMNYSEYFSSYEIISGGD